MCWPANELSNPSKTRKSPYIPLVQATLYALPLLQLLNQLNITFDYQWPQYLVIRFATRFDRVTARLYVNTPLNLVHAK